MTLTFTKPLPDEHTPYFSNYIDLVTGDPFDYMTHTHAALYGMINDLSDVQVGARPAPGEWSIKEIIGHLSDTERIFSYRALRFARNDATPLASFDQNAYVPAADFNAWTLVDVWSEYDAVRAATIALFRSLSDEAFLRRGPMSGNVTSVRALLYAIAGHEQHHLISIRSIRDVYLGR
jgi:hypothetical protein